MVNAVGLSVNRKKSRILEQYNNNSGNNRARTQYCLFGYPLFMVRVQLQFEWKILDFFFASFTFPL